MSNKRPWLSRTHVGGQEGLNYSGLKIFPGAGRFPGREPGQSGSTNCDRRLFRVRLCSSSHVRFVYFVPWWMLMSLVCVLLMGFRIDTFSGASCSRSRLNLNLIRISCAYISGYEKFNALISPSSSKSVTQTK